MMASSRARNRPEPGEASAILGSAVITTISDAFGAGASGPAARSGWRVECLRGSGGGDLLLEPRIELGQDDHLRSSRVNQILIGRGEHPVYLLARYGNRHGMVAGATGTGTGTGPGTTISLLLLAEGTGFRGRPSRGPALGNQAPPGAPGNHGRASRAQRLQPARPADLARRSGRDPRRIAPPLVSMASTTLESRR